jgi:hypothetical protein
MALSDQSMPETCGFDLGNVQKMIILHLFSNLDQQNRLSCRAHHHIQCPGEADRNPQQLFV